MQIAKLLLNKKSDVNAKDKYGCTPLMRAAEQGHEEMTKLLLSHNADVSIEDNYLTSAAGWARSRGINSDKFRNIQLHILTNDMFDGSGNYNIADILRNAQLYRGESNNTDNSKIAFYEESDESDESNTDDEEISDVNKRDSNLRTPLHLAVLRGDINMVNSLLAKKNINVNAVDDVGSNALHRAAESGNFLILNSK